MVKTLLELGQGKRAKIVGIGEGLEFRRKLATLNVREGKELKVVACQPFGGPVCIEIDGRKSTLGMGMAGRVMVEELQ